jgi:hypothetical protein
MHSQVCTSVSDRAMAGWTIDAIFAQDREYLPNRTNPQVDLVWRSNFRVLVNTRARIFSFCGLLLCPLPNAASLKPFKCSQGILLNYRTAVCAMGHVCKRGRRSVPLAHTFRQLHHRQVRSRIRSPVPSAATMLSCKFLILRLLQSSFSIAVQLAHYL